MPATFLHTGYPRPKSMRLPVSDDTKGVMMMKRMSKVLLTAIAIASAAAFSIPVAQAEGGKNCTLPGTWLGCKSTGGNYDCETDIKLSSSVASKPQGLDIDLVVNIDTTDRYGKELSIHASHDYGHVPNFIGAALQTGKDGNWTEYQYRLFSQPKLDNRDGRYCYGVRGVMYVNLKKCKMEFREQLTMDGFSTLDAPAGEAACGIGGRRANVLEHFTGHAEKLDVSEFPPHPNQQQ